MAFDALMESPYARAPHALSEFLLLELLTGATTHTIERARSAAWVAEVMGVALASPVTFPPPALVKVLLGFATMRVGGWMTADARNAAWAVFKHWANVCPAMVPSDTWRALQQESRLLAFEDFDNEFGEHVLTCDQWNNLLPVASSIPYDMLVM
jgi:hypothetical protein